MGEVNNAYLVLDGVSSSDVCIGLYKTLSSNKLGMLSNTTNNSIWFTQNSERVKGQDLDNETISGYIIVIKSSQLNTVFMPEDN